MIVEPVAGNMNLVLPKPGFLESLRENCTRHGAVLIFDEVMTGFRVALGGAQARYGIRPDLTTLGKVIGGGLPVGAFGGRREIMEKIAPLGPVYQAGTLSGNPVAVAAGLATLKLVEAKDFQSKIEATTRSLVEGLIAEARKAKVVFSAQSIGSMFGLYFRAAPPTSFAEVMQCDKDRFNKFFHAHARARRVPGAVGLRSGIRLRGAWRGGNRCDARRRARGVQSLGQRVMSKSAGHGHMREATRPLKCARDVTIAGRVLGEQDVARRRSGGAYRRPVRFRRHRWSRR